MATHPLEENAGPAFYWEANANTCFFSRYTPRIERGCVKNSCKPTQSVSFSTTSVLWGASGLPAEVKKMGESLIVRAKTDKSLFRKTRSLIVVSSVKHLNAVHIESMVNLKI
ncbi:hypothetical protein CDAR_282071 [Caerostris darwini]|uniref:Uncharacterized protein n=1 Tax=Caerostris darwini TaxID=1538125 RepID=A0AAV4WR42_9ARAC|nr:hypothetical protein CDAR_282071 [Caerostris darwini]